MCLYVYHGSDWNLMNSFRHRGHRLIKGWKQVGYNGERIVSFLQENYTWRSGWNRAVDKRGSRLPIKTYYSEKELRPYFSWRGIPYPARTFYAGIHIHLDKPPNPSGHKVIRTVWFYADEVKGANGTQRQVVVNRALMRRAY